MAVEWRYCDRCHGTGKVDGADCPECEGTKIVIEENVKGGRHGGAL